MSRYFPADDMVWEQATVRGGAVMSKSIVWEGEYDTRSAFFRMPKNMHIPKHTHPNWVQVRVVDGEIEVESDEDGPVRIKAGGCYFVEAGDTHVETAIEDSLVLVTQGEDRAEFMTGTRLDND